MLRTIAYYEEQRDADDLEDESIWETVEATAGDGIDSDDDDGDGSLPKEDGPEKADPNMSEIPDVDDKNIVTLHRKMLSTFGPRSIAEKTSIPSCP